MFKKKSKKKAALTEIVETPKTEVLQMKPSVDVLDMKLTRSELIDLISEEYETDLQNQVKELRKKLNEVDSDLKKHFLEMSEEDIINNVVIPNAKKLLAKREERLTENNIQYSSYDGNKLSLGSLYVSISIPTEFTNRRKKIVKQIDELNGKIQKLNTKAGKLEIMKQMLAASEDGKRLLDQIKVFKTNSRNLLPST